jgi:hypothetical protein
MTADVQGMVDAFKRDHPETWAEAQSPTRDLADAWDARIRLMDEPAALQGEMDSLSSQYASMTSTSLLEKYAFIPAHPHAPATCGFCGWRAQSSKTPGGG